MLFTQVAFAEGTQAAPNYLSDTVFKKLITADTSVWIALAGLVALGLILLVIAKSKKNWNARMIAFAALSIALSYALSFIRLYRMPTGGSVTPGSMLPLMLFSASFGVGPGFVAGLAYGILQYFQGGWFLNFWQVVFDYLIAFASLGLAGISKKLPEKWGLYVGIVIAAVCRAISAISAGMMWAADSLANGKPLDIAGVNYSNTPFLYSLLYNGLYLIPDTIICLVLAFFIGKRVIKEMKKH